MRTISEGEYLEINGPLEDGHVEITVDAPDEEQVYIMLEQNGDHVGTFYLRPDDAELLAWSIYAGLKFVQSEAFKQKQRECLDRLARKRAEAEAECEASTSEVSPHIDEAICSLIEQGLVEDCGNGFVRLTELGRTAKLVEV